MAGPHGSALNAFIMKEKTPLQKLVDALPMPLLLANFAECGIMVRICNVQISKESTPQNIKYEPSFSVSFGSEGREILQYRNESDLNKCFVNGIKWFCERPGFSRVERHFNQLLIQMERIEGEIILRKLKGTL